MGSYAYLTAGIITARQAELMKNAFWPMLRQGLLYTIPLTLVSLRSASSLPCCVRFSLSTNTGIKTDRRNLYLGIPRNTTACTVIYHVLGYL